VNVNAIEDACPKAIHVPKQPANFVAKFKIRKSNFRSGWFVAIQLQIDDNVRRWIDGGLAVLNAKAMNAPEIDGLAEAHDTL